MTQWEYLVESVPLDNPKDAMTKFNNLGDQGWEIISCVPDSADPRWLFVLLKRPKHGAAYGEG